MDFILQPWPWYITGPLIGLMVPALLIFGNRQFGISITFKHICAACLPTKHPFFNYDWKKEMWVLVLAMGMISGGYIANHFLVQDNQLNLSGQSGVMFEDWRLYYGAPQEIHDVHENGDEGVMVTDSKRVLMPERIFSFNSFSSPLGWIFLVLGGFLVGFGTRWANGCTSGHAIMGLSILNPGSLLAVIGFFIGGLTVSWFVIPALL